jgi:hypothetical protein
VASLNLLSIAFHKQYFFLTDPKSSEAESNIAGFLKYYLNPSRAKRV